MTKFNENFDIEGPVFIINTDNDTITEDELNIVNRFRE